MKYDDHTSLYLSVHAANYFLFGRIFDNTELQTESQNYS